MGASDIFGWMSFGFNIVAVIVLLAALLPPFIDTVKSKKTYGIGQKFFIFYVGGGMMMLLNAIIFLASGQATDASQIILFTSFVVSNTISISLNSFIWIVKRKNMSNAAKLGITEQQYYEQYLLKESKQ